MESALDRFARTRGAALLGLTAMGRQWKIQTAVGGGLLGLAGVFGVIASVAHEPGLLGGTVGPGLAGLINLSLGLAFRRQANARAVAQVALSNEAGALLRALFARAQVWQTREGDWRRSVRGSYHWPGNRVPVAPSPDAMEALERAASAHNRVTDALGESKDERANRLRAAADAGMVEALHLAATRGEDVPALDGTVVRLDELATLVERSIERPEAPSALRSNLESTLEELRAEDAARQELRG